MAVALPQSMPAIYMGDEYKLTRLQDNTKSTVDLLLRATAALQAAVTALQNAPAPTPTITYPLTAPAGSAAAYNFVNTSTGQWFDSLGSFSGSPGLVWKVNGTDQAGIDQTGTLSTSFVDILRVILHAISSGGASTSNITVQAGIGAPTGTCPKGSVYLRSDGGAGTTLYINETGTNVWRAI